MNIREQSPPEEEINKSDPTHFDGAPTKRFFVSMLPRDIDLDDSILDLVDNCVDGAMRSQPAGRNAELPFAGFCCEISISAEKFVIKDNCGGIPSSYLNAAFRLGRPSQDPDEKLPTIGIYGIGMKRAIFKMGKEAEVVSRSKDRAVKVRYSRAWLDPDSDTWELPFEEIEKGAESGVTITIPVLHASIAKKFQQDAFIDELKDKLGQHFAYIMGKGFEIRLNGTPVTPVTVQLILSRKIEPFDYQTIVGGVEIKVTVGFYRNLTRQTELEESTDADVSKPEESATDEAGITVICNDRIVVVSDRTTITGWGVANTPRYHPQFRAITGLISFSTANPEDLPISTTKRDLDTDSDVFRPARNAAMDGLSMCVGFTNKWKGIEEEVDKMLQPKNRVEARTVQLAAEKGKSVRGDQAGKRYKPDLPRPPKGNTRRRIAFSRDVDEIKRIAEHFFSNDSKKPGEVGIAAWVDTLRRVTKA